MSLEQSVLRLAGIVVLASVALSLLVHPYWIALTLFAGANMILVSFTGFCPAIALFRKMGRARRVR